jgi:hypothetical protein
MKANEIIEDNKTAVMIFTDGLNLEINRDGSGKSGVWVISPKAEVDKVIVYFRNKTRNINEIYVGDFSGLTPSQIKGYENRLTINFNNMKFAGFTRANWNQFTGTKRGSVSPIKYLR